MKLLQIMLFGSASLIGSTALGQSFNAGSDGSFGPISVAASQTLTIPLPPDGIIHATTVTLATNSTLRFTKNSKNTPVYLLATGNVQLSGIIDVGGGSTAQLISGAGGPGGFDGGEPGIAGAPGGDGIGPGGGQAGTPAGGGAYGTRALCANCGEVYGSQLMFPMLGGSGGGALSGGGGGGGAILVASNTRISCTVGNCVYAIGGSSANFGGGGGIGGGGSGGAIRLLAPRIDGTGSLSVGGGSASGGNGRIRIDLIDRSGFQLSLGSGPVTVGSFMQTFPGTAAPRLDFTSVAGTAIPDGSNSVLVTLPFNAPSAQTITLRARDFTGTVPVRVVLTPVSGPRIVVDDTIDMAGQATVTKVINVSVPQNVSIRVNAWSR